ncbi:hypothetical protein N9924_00055 [bacterium]|nr:hypothetical protein [bacterium]
MIDLILTILSGAGVTFIVTRGKIFKSSREWVTAKNLLLGDVVTCPQCFGLYGGMLSYLLVQYNFDILVYGLIVSFLCFILNKW